MTNNNLIDSLNNNPEKKQFNLPFYSDWAERKGIKLPKTFGISTFTTYMDRGIDVNSVNVKFKQESHNINKTTDFDVRNKTLVNAIKLDAWVLPFLNVYFLGGYSLTNSDIMVNLTPVRLPINKELYTKQSVKGPYSGIGATLATGYKSWFIMSDINYGKNWPDLINNTVNFTLISLRTGISKNIGKNNIFRTWAGALYMNSKTTLEIEEHSNLLGNVLILIDQQPKNPLTYQVGFSFEFNRTFEIITEVGSDFNESSMVIFNLGYRF